MIGITTAVRKGRLVHRRRIGMLMLSSMLAAVLSGIGGASYAASTRTAPLKGTITISDWRFLTNGTGQALEKVYSAFERSHPGVKVSFQTVAYDDYPSTIKTELGAGGGPDIMALADSDFFQIQKAGLLTPITSLTPQEIASLRPANKLFYIHRQRMGVISTTTLYGFLYNKNLFSQAGIASPPSNFNQFLADCMAIKQKTGKYGFAARNMLNEEAGWYEDFTDTFITGFGGSWSNSKGEFTINQANNIKAVTAFKKVYDSGCMDTGETAAVFRPEFEDGDIGMMMDNSNAAFSYTYGNSTVTNNVMGSAPMPMPTGVGGTDFVVLGVNKNAPNKSLVQQYMKWLLEPAQQRGLANALAPVTIGTDVLPTKQFNAAHPWAAEYYKEISQNPPNGMMQRRYQLTNNLGEIVMPYIAQVLSNQLSPSAALNEAQVAAVSALGKG